MINQITQQPQISFQSLKPSLRDGMEAIRYFRSTYPGIKSSTRIAIRVFRMQDNPKIEEMFPALLIILKNLKMQIEQSRLLLDFLTSFASSTLPKRQEYVSNLTHLVKRFKAANCGEMVDIIQWELIKKGRNTNRILMKIIKSDEPPNNQRFFNDHVFIVMDMAKKGKPDKPGTWGSKAVIVDPWLGEVAPAHEMLRRYKSYLKVGDDEILTFQENNILLNLQA